MTALGWATAVDKLRQAAFVARRVQRGDGDPIVA